MLSRRQKIRRVEFLKVLSKGKIFHFPLFLLRIFFDKEQSAAPSRISFVVSAKVSKKAVVRNKLKRRGYAIIQKHKTKISPGCMCVFFLKKESAAALFKELEKEIIAAFKRAQIFYE